MSILRSVSTTVIGLALLGAVMSPGAKADESNRKTIISFSGPVEIPGVHLKGWGVLPAGTYVFKIIDSKSDRHIVQIFNKEETEIYATILAIPNYRLRATDKTVITFNERPAGQPEALRAWFYPGRNWGEEFVYGKAMAMQLAKETNTTVLYTPAEIPAEVAEPIRSADAPEVAALHAAPVMAIKPTGEDVELAQVVTPPPVQEPVKEVAAAVQEPVKEMPAPRQVAALELPQTESALPLIFLLGMLALGGAWGIKLVQKRTL